MRIWAGTGRRAPGKSDPIDAEAAAGAALAGVATAVPKADTGMVEAIRVILVARRGAVQARTSRLHSGAYRAIELAGQQLF